MKSAEEQPHRNRARLRNGGRSVLQPRLRRRRREPKPLRQRNDCVPRGTEGVFAIVHAAGAPRLSGVDARVVLGRGGTYTVPWLFRAALFSDA